ncbi:universal stress protein [Agriterribacter sp.]|uniref:universal stress protein n=1 Tax=Agriterribacter sp. TaxID=2821509 RepID=UPI002C5386FD|nr:universal stress protein [Agriterribacter sp.]HRO47204.1 universal stress protein [Agriterribacter sp.]HRQ18438.1 universal stress protein [Agriterribacter sp.]
MKKIIAAFDGLKFSKSTRDYAIQIARENNAHLVGLFLDDPFYQSYKVYDLIGEEGGISPEKQEAFLAADAKTRDEAVAGFEAACRKAGLQYTVRRNKEIATQGLLQESIYADMVVIGGNETFTNRGEQAPTRFIRDILSAVQCPVLVVPAHYKPFGKLVLLFDGEPSSVHAIKMFSYMLPALKAHPAEVLSVKPMSQSLHLPDNKLMREFMKRHFPKAAYKVMKGIPETEIINFLKEEKQSPLVVLGAYQRGMVSRWFRPSMADVLIKELKLPVFIAHN